MKKLALEFAWKFPVTVTVIGALAWGICWLFTKALDSSDDRFQERYERSPDEYRTGIAS